jgi:hypothetical protein
MIIYTTNTAYYREIPAGYGFLLCSQGVFSILPYGHSRNAVYNLREAFIDRPDFRGWGAFARGVKRTSRRWIALMSTREEAESIADALKGVRHGSKKFHTILHLMADEVR